MYFYGLSSNNSVYLCDNVEFLISVTMRRLTYILLIFIAVFCMASCGNSSNEKGDGYRIVFVTKDGSKEVEKIEAQNDTDAVRQFTQKVSTIVFSNLDKEEPPFEDAYVLSPDGDKLNKNEELLKAAIGDIESMADEMKQLSDSLQAELEKIN